MALLGFAPEPALASIRYYRLAAAKVTRNTCTYCSVGGGMLLTLDPRFTRTSAVADYHAYIRTGIASVYLGGLINVLLTTDQIQHASVRAYTDVAIIVKEDYGFHDGFFSGFGEDKRRAYKTSPRAT